MSVAEVIAHRGITTTHRENTLPAFLEAMAAEANGIELDVHATSDGVLVVHHDAAIPPTTGTARRRAVDSMTLSELRRACLGKEEVPTLDEVLEAVAGRVKVYVELKASGIEAAVSRALQGRSDWTAVHSFDHRAIVRMRELAPEIPRGVLMSSYLVDPLAPLRDTSAIDLWQAAELMDAELIARVHESGGRVIAWTVNDLDAARQLRDWDVDGLCTDQAVEMLQLIRK